MESDGIWLDEIGWEWSRPNDNYLLIGLAEIRILRSGRMDLQLSQAIHVPVDSIGWGQKSHQVIEDAVSILSVGHVGGRYVAPVDATQAERMQSIHGVVPPLAARWALDGQFSHPVGPDGALQLTQAVDVVHRRRRRRLAEHDAVHVGEHQPQRRVVTFHLRRPNQNNQRWFNRLIIFIINEFIIQSISW